MNLGVIYPLSSFSIINRNLFLDFSSFNVSVKHHLKQYRLFCDAFRSYVFFRKMRIIGTIFYDNFVGLEKTADTSYHNQSWYCDYNTVALRVINFNFFFFVHSVALKPRKHRIIVIYFSNYYHFAVVELDSRGGPKAILIRKLSKSSRKFVWQNFPYEFRFQTNAHLHVFHVPSPKLWFRF